MKHLLGSCVTLVWLGVAAGCGGGHGGTSDSDAGANEGPDAGMPTPQGLAELGMGTHDLSRFTTTTVATESDGLADPRDLQFNPNADHELWIVNYTNRTMVIVSHAGEEAQATHRARSDGGQHFMIRPSALAFGQATMATAHEMDAPTQSSTPDDFMGPTLWRADAALFDAGWASHIDMLHNSPNAVGIAWDHDNVFWVFDGFHRAITRYDFRLDHGPGGEDHSDGIAARYVEGSVSYVRGVSSHMELDHDTGLLYVADSGNARVAVLDTSTGTRGRDIDPNYDGGDQYIMNGATLTTLVETGLTQPSGLALHAGHLFVGDRATAVVHAYSLDGAEIDWLDLSSEIEPGSLGGLEFDAEGRLYVTDVVGNRVLRFARN